MTEELDLSPEEQEELQKFVSGSSYGAPAQEDKHNVHKFLHDVVTTQDTTKLGYLNDEEIGLPKHPLRTLKELSLFCKDVANMGYFSEYFNKKGEILTATSLSKDGKLIDLSVVTRREVGDVTKRKSTKENKSWFKSKNKGTEAVE